MHVTPAPALPSTGCSFKLKTKDDLDFPRHLKDITVKAYHPEHGRVGVLYARRIDRKPCRDRGDFHQIMERSETDDFPTFAAILFDKRGQLRPEFTANEHQKGTGAFGHELDDGILLYVIAVRVQPEVRPKHCFVDLNVTVAQCAPQLRRRGVASQLLSALAHSRYGAEAVSIIACPGVIERVEDRETWLAQKSIAVNLFLKVWLSPSFTPIQAHTPDLCDTYAHIGTVSPYD